MVIIPEPDPANPQSWNRYAYVMNNPLNATDPFGLCYFGDGATIGVSGPRELGLECGTSALEAGKPDPNKRPHIDTPPVHVYAEPDPIEAIKSDIAMFISLVKSTWRPTSTTPTIGPASQPSNCRYVDPLSAGVEITAKFGPGVQAGPVDVGLSMFTHTLGEQGTGSSFDLGVKGILSIQGKRDNAWASNPLSWSATVFGVRKDLNTSLFSSSGWNFQPSKEFKVGLQAIVGVEVGWNSDKFKQQVNRNIACGYKN